MTRKTYPLEFTLDAVALARENGAQIAQVARDLGLAKTTLLNWVRKAEKGDSPRDLHHQGFRLQFLGRFMVRSLGGLH